jgi:hypothetical protein
MNEELTLKDIKSVVSKVENEISKQLENLRKEINCEIDSVYYNSYDKERPTHIKVSFKYLD